MAYIHLNELTELPDLSALYPFKAIVIADEPVAPELLPEISAWLVDTGCRYMMAWGEDCCAWADAVDAANVAAFDSAEIPDDSIVMTTWHEDELLTEVFWFSKHSAMHPCFALDNLVFLHLAKQGREDEILSAYAAV